MGKQEKIRGANVRAALIFRRIQEIRKGGLERMTAELESLFRDLSEKKEIDNDTAEVLYNVYLHKKSEIENMEDRIGEKILSVVEKFKMNNDDGKSIILLTLSKDGDLFREPKEKYCYPMKKEGKRLNLIRFLAGEKKLVSGRDIATILETSYGATTGAIKEINSIAERRLGLPKSKKLIASKSHDGYKLNDLYPITIV